MTVDAGPPGEAYTCPRRPCRTVLTQRPRSMKCPGCSVIYPKRLWGLPDSAAPEGYDE